MLRWSLGLTKLNHIQNVEIRKRLGVEPIVDTLRECRLRRYGHVMRSNVNSVASVATSMDVPGRRPRGRPKKRWMESIARDMQEVGMDPEDVFDRVKWRRCTKR